MRRRATALAFLALLLGCEDSLTEVVVRTEIRGYDIPADVDTVWFFIGRPNRDGTFTEYAEKLVLLESLPSERRTSFTFTVIHEDELPLEGWVIEASPRVGPDAMGVPFANVRRPFRFRQGETVELTVRIDAACRAVQCESPDEVCVDGECVRDPDVVVDMGPQVLPDLGPNDLGPNDLGPADLGPADLGPPDMGPPSNLMCPASCEPCLVEVCDGRRGENDCVCMGDENGGCPCELRCSPGAVCEMYCESVTGGTCLVEASGAGAFYAQCDDSVDCQVDATNAGIVEVDCKKPGGHCVTDCTGATNCVVECRLGAHCTLQCGGGGSCGIDASKSDCEPVDCGGGVWVCNATCPP